ncbi:tetratricopeptide repeat protein [Saccharopolyspora hirsuta]|uniref:Tetratricopeptide repeat protein n=1 Tax=Saccharopolyspora hirsuta TaxID=1837 RepID=A0A5M7BN97_SACHI|nr:tetratricopeptide repeat protein [Saccharopolyspora hirsuta]KAA5830500.1 tetratricopeptide repeat protein [Saccharopolyspora hirsuta]
MSGLRPGDDGPEVRNELSGSVHGAVFQVGTWNGSVNTGEPEVVPHQVPVLTGEFVNRTRELGRAGELLDPTAGSVRIAVFTGLPGVGKTAVVQQAVARTERAFPGGELYVDFAQLRDGGGTAVNDGLADCLRALGVHDKVMPSTLAGRASLYRTRTRDRPVLVVLDDVVEPAEVAPFVPSSTGSTVLVTSNRKLSELVLDDAAVVPVEPLSDESGVELLDAWRGANADPDPAATRQLAALCGGLPIALRIAAARLRSQPSLAVADLVAEITAEDTGLAPFEFPGASRVAAVFTACYRDLPESAARLYRDLGQLPGADFDSQLVAALGDGPPAEQRRALSVLVEANLVADWGNGRYRLHNLVRRHARERAAQEDPTGRAREAVLRRAVDFYLRRSAFADLAVMGPQRLRITPHQELLGTEPGPFQGDSAKQQALRWMDLERPNLVAVQRAAVDQGWCREGWQLAEAMTALFVNRRYLEDWVESTRLGVWAARLDENPAAVARLRSFVSRAYADLGDLPEAQAALDESLPVAEATGSRRLVASVWELIGRLHDERTSEEAISAYQRALALFTAADDSRGVAFVTFFLGRSQLARGRAREGLATLERALELIRAVPDQRMAGRAMAAIGTAHDALGDSAKAVATLGRAIEQLSAGEDQFYEAQAREALAEVAARQGNRDLQRENLQRALEIHATFGSPRTAELRDALAELA